MACRVFSLQHGGSLVVICGISFPDQGWNLGPLVWQCRVLVAGPPGYDKCRCDTWLNSHNIPGEGVGHYPHLTDEGGEAQPGLRTTQTVLLAVGHDLATRQPQPPGPGESPSRVRCVPMDCGPPGSSIHGLFQARVLEWVAISFSRAFSWPRDQTQVSRTAGRRFIVWATREAPTGRHRGGLHKCLHFSRVHVCPLSVCLGASGFRSSCLIISLPVSLP